MLTASGPDGPSGVAAFAPARPARDLRFPVPPRTALFALALANPGEADASCAAALTLAGSGATLAAGTPVEIAGASTEIRFLADLFELPEDFEGGELALRCGREISALALPAAVTAAFDAAPPVAAATE